MIRSILILIATYAMILAAAGCNAEDPGAIAAASARADGLQDNLALTSNDTTVLADRLTLEVAAGVKATPLSNTEAQKHWYGIGILIESVRAFGARLMKFSDDVVVIKKDLTQAAADRAAVQAKLDKATSDGTRALRRVIVVGVVAVGLLVGFGLFTQNYRLSVIGIVSAAATILTAQLALHSEQVSFSGWFWWVTGGVLVACVVYFIIEWKARGSFAAAVKTNPIQDFFDLFHKSCQGVATVTTPAGTVGIVGDAVQSPTPAATPGAD